MSSQQTFTVLAATILIVNIGIVHSLPPPMLRTVCGAFADAEEAFGNQAMAAGKAAVDLAMKPIAIAGGLKAAAVGAGMKVGGGAIKYVGEKMAKDGAVLEATGAGVKGAGLGVAALGVRPLAEKIVTAGKAAEGTVNAAQQAAEGFAKNIGDSSIKLDATIDSPFIGHHHKGVSVTAGLDTALHNPLLQGKDGQQIEQQVQQQQQQQQIEETKQQETKQEVDQERKVDKRAPKIDTEVLKSALTLVKDAKMQDCVARAICDLNCNPQGFGQDGKQVFLNMVKLQGAKVLEEDDSKFFHDAANKGRQNSGKCEACSKEYPNCKAKSTDLIKMACHIKME